MYSAGADADDHTVLEPFKILRQVRSVTFDEPLSRGIEDIETLGTPKAYANYLKGIMEGSGPPDPILPMYSGLLDYTLESPGRYPFAFDLALDTLQRGRCKELKRVVQSLVTVVDAELAEAHRLLRQCDGLPEEKDVDREDSGQDSEHRFVKIRNKRKRIKNMIGEVNILKKLLIW